MKHFFHFLRVYAHKNMVIIALLGFSSGLPLPLGANTLDALLNEAGVTKTAIGLFALIGLPYTLKFIWAPLIDHLPIPLLTRWLGRRRGWIIATQLCVIGSLLGIGYTDPATELAITAFWAVCLSFFSASQDIVIDAYRVDLLEKNQQGAGASSATFGYIIAMKLIGGAFALFLSDYLTWSFVYTAMAAIMIVGIITVCLASEPSPLSEPKHTQPNPTFSDWFYQSVICPFQDFTRHSSWWLILLFITFYKCGDAFAGKMLIPFLQDTGFSNSQIAFYLKTYGLAATLFGTFMGGAMIYRLGNMKTLWICGGLQMLSNLTFTVQSLIGDNANFLAIAIAIENISAGMGTAALIAYLASLCHKNYTATQYALLSSCAAIGRTVISASSGWVFTFSNWPVFFLLSTLVALPGLVILYILDKNLKTTP